MPSVDISGTLVRGARPQTRISMHAIDRYIERVDASVSRLNAEREIDEILTAGTRRATPRRWMRNVRKTPGLRFVYWHVRPDICVLLLADTVITVLTRNRPTPALRLGTELAVVIPFAASGHVYPAPNDQAAAIAAA
jgi:hypothetical protein